MSELNIQVPQHNPLAGKPASIADNYRKGEQAKLQKQLANIKMKGEVRKEQDYWLKKRTENYVFSHYPSGSYAHWSKGLGGLKFTSSNKHKLQNEWKAQVGGNLAGFEQFYQMGKKAEMEGLKKSLIYDPSSNMTRTSWDKMVTETIDGWDSYERSKWFNNMDSETRLYVNGVYKPDEFRGLWDDPETGEPGSISRGLGDLGIAKEKYLGDLGIEDFKYPAIAGVSYAGWRKLKNMGAEAVDDIGDTVDDIVKTGKKRFNVPSDDIFNKLYRTGSGGVTGDIIESSELKAISQRANQMIKSGDMEIDVYKKFMKIVADLRKSGKDVTTKAIWEGVQALGDGGEKLGRVLKENHSRLGLKGLGIVAAGGGLAGGVASHALAKEAVTALAGGKNAEEWGEVAGAAVTPFTIGPSAAATTVIRDKIKQHGAKKVLLHIGKTAGWRKLGQLMAKQGIGHLFGIGTSGLGYAASGAFLIADLVYINSIIQDME